MKHLLLSLLLAVTALGQSGGAGAIAISSPPPSSGPGSGDVVGPASSTDNALVRWDGTTGKLIKDSSVTLVGTALTGTTASDLTLTAGGTNQNVTLTPSGTGFITLGGTTGGVRLPSTNTAGLQLYNTADQTTNYERLALRWGGNVAIITSEAAGSGTIRNMLLRATDNGSNTSSLTLGINASPFFNYSMTPTTASGNHVQFAINNTRTSGSPVAFAITPTYNQASGTAANTDLLVNRTQTAVGSGAQLLADFQVGGSSMFSVTNTGRVNFSSTDTALVRSAASRLDFTGGNTVEFRVLSNGGNTGTIVHNNTDFTITNRAVSGSLILQTNATTALTLDSSQNATFAGTVTFQEGQVVDVRVTSGTTETLTTDDYFVTFSNASPVTANLPAGATGRTFKLKNKGAGTVTVDPNGAEQLFSTSAVNTYDLVTGAAIEIIWDGSQWSIL